MAPSISWSRFIIATLLSVASVAAPGAGAVTHSHEAILEAAKAFLETEARRQQLGRVEVTMGRLDPRLRLSACGFPLEVFQPTGARLSGQTNAGVRCPGPTPWSIYTSAKVKVFVNALVTTRALPRGARLSQGDTTLRETEASALSLGYIRNADKLEGMILTRPATAGALLTPSMFKAEQIVKRGDRVRLQDGKGAVQVEMLGEAMTSGAVGERVRVRALNSHRIVEGWVVAPSVVKMTF